MGRGLGSVQKAILVTMTRHQSLSVEDIAAIVYRVGSHKPTDTQLGTVHKAVRALTVRGMVKPSGYPTAKGDLGWMLANPAPAPLELPPVPTKSRGRLRAVK
jgi:hypothetical protein